MLQPLLTPGCTHARATSDILIKYCNEEFKDASNLSHFGHNGQNKNADCILSEVVRGFYQGVLCFHVVLKSHGTRLHVISFTLSLPMALQPGEGLGLLQEFLPS